MNCKDKNKYNYLIEDFKLTNEHKYFTVDRGDNEWVKVFYSPSNDTFYQL